MKIMFVFFLICISFSYLQIKISEKKENLISLEDFCQEANWVKSKYMASYTNQLSAPAGLWSDPWLSVFIYEERKRLTKGGKAASISLLKNVQIFMF